MDWRRIAYHTLVSRALDDVEETTNRNRAHVPKDHLVLYQFSARGHDMAQAILGSFIDHPHDAAGAYYRSRPLLLSLGLEIEDALGSPLGRAGGFSDGRDIGVVCNLPTRQGPKVLPMSGDVGSQYTPVAGWAQSIQYHRDVLGDASWRGAMAVALGGDGSVATNGFWSALTMATTLKLPVLFYIEDNNLGISVRGEMQTPGANIARNLASFGNLFIRDGDRYFGTSGFGPAFSPTAAIPEPETYAMMLAGLGLLGFVGKRRMGRGKPEEPSIKEVDRA
jgi:2-oxoisovalerate dehydrogenase E1 component